MTFGLSRDDAGGILESYYKAKIFESDPFAGSTSQRGHADENSRRRRKEDKAEP